MDQPQPTSRQGLRTNHRLSNRLAVHRINPALHTPYRKSMKLHEIVLNQTLSVKEHRAVGGKRLRTREPRSEEHTSELQSLMRISYAVFCLKKKNNIYKI